MWIYKNFAPYIYAQKNLFVYKFKNKQLCWIKFFKRTVFINKPKTCDPICEYLGFIFQILIISKTFTTNWNNLKHLPWMWILFKLWTPFVNTTLKFNFFLKEAPSTLDCRAGRATKPPEKHGRCYVGQKPGRICQASAWTLCCAGPRIRSEALLTS